MTPSQPTQRTDGGSGAIVEPPSRPSPPATAQHRRFFGSVELDTLRYQRDFEQIAEAVLQHLASETGAAVTIRLEIEATAAGGFSEQVMRTVSENSNTLKFTSSEFERKDSGGYAAKGVSSSAEV